MAEPLLEIEKRLDRIELAIRTMGVRLIQAQTGYGARDAVSIDEILRGEKTEDKTDG